MVNLTAHEADYIEDTVILGFEARDNMVVSRAAFTTAKLAADQIDSQQTLKDLGAWVLENERGFVIVIDRNKLTKKVSELAEIIKPVAPNERELESTKVRDRGYLNQSSIKGWTLKGDKYFSKRKYPDVRDAALDLYLNRKIFYGIDYQIEKEGEIYRITVKKDSIENLP